MTTKKNKLMTFLWSLIPGAGEMYLGFFKMGISLMSLFVLLLSLSGFLQLNVLSLLAPVVWFYSFFHTNNLNSLPDDEFYAVEDDFLICADDLKRHGSFFRMHRKFTAACLIFFGTAVLWSNLYRLLFRYLIPYLHLGRRTEELLYSLASSIPQLAVAAVLIAAGLLMIYGKSRSLRESSDTGDSSGPAPGSGSACGAPGGAFSNAAPDASFSQRAEKGAAADEAEAAIETAAAAQEAGRP